MNLKSGRALKLSLMACGFTILVGTASMQAVSAKSYDHVVSNSVMTTPSTSRNVNFTGIYPLYNKPADVKGARVVATAATLDRLANANVSTDNVRAYRVAETNSGSVYYKVVTFDGQYRGWIYGGKNKASFNGGVTAYTTFASQNLSAVQQGSTYKIANPGTANDGKTVTYQSPEWTQYKVAGQSPTQRLMLNQFSKLTKPVRGPVKMINGFTLPMSPMPIRLLMVGS
ncbi:hypothetical protein C5L32_001828 [Lentilactobacillus buchneri]|uniref:S-layer protein n=2 Tax=Lentilactobacillus buchneri TaxID=1581 RepID=A0A4R5NV46_LENBU|nr:hypothetical protein C5L32_001828 [Lentilactobacillus buchneri]GEP13885.1 hypothetical protein LBU01_10300 [Lentilactobacillus buchneri]